VTTGKVEDGVGLVPVGLAEGAFVDGGANVGDCWGCVGVGDVGISLGALEGLEVEVGHEVGTWLEGEPEGNSVDAGVDGLSEGGVVEEGCGGEGVVSIEDGEGVAPVDDGLGDDPCSGAVGVDTAG